MPTSRLTDAATMEARLAKSAAPERFRAIVTGTLAGLTLLLAIVGLHGVVSYAVTQRTREIGVRLALGQRPSDVVRLVLLETLRTVVGGRGAWGPLLRLCRPVAVVGGDGERGPDGRTERCGGNLRGRGSRRRRGPRWRASRVDPIVALRTS